MKQVAIGQAGVERHAQVFDSPDAMGEHVAMMDDYVVPASFIFECPNPISLLDQEAVS
jgi:hypothetical protein